MREFTEHDAAVIGAGTHGHGVRPKRRSPRPVLTAAAVVALAGLAWWAEAQEARQQAQDTARVLLANRWMSEDPTQAALVLLEVVNPEQTPYAIATMIEALGQPLSYSVLDEGTIAVFSRIAVFSPDGTKVATGHRYVSVNNTDGSGKPVILPRSESPRSVAFNPNGTKIVAAQRGGTARVWNLYGSRVPVVLRGHDGDVVSAAFNPDGTKIVTASEDRTAPVWNVGVRPTDGLEGRTPGEPLVLRHQGPVRSATFNADGTMVVTTSERTAWVWNVGVRPTDGSEGRTSGVPVVLRGHDGDVVSAAFNPDGTKIVTTSEDNTARVWNVGVRPTDGSGMPVVLRGHGGVVVSAAFNPDGTKVVTASRDGTARVWNVGVRPTDGPEGRTPGVPLVLRGHADGLRTAAFNPDGTKVVTASDDRTARVWNLDGPEGRIPGEPLVLRGHEGAVRSAAFNADGTMVLTASADGTARVWNLGREPVVLRGHEDAVLNATFNHDGTKVLTASDDNTARVWNADGSGVPVVLRGHERHMHNAAFSPDGTKVLTSAGDGTARVWNVDGSGEPVVLREDEGVGRAAFNADGTKVVTAYWRGPVRVWNADGSGVPVVLREPEGVRTAAFNPDGTKVVTASGDGAARVWNVDGTGEPLVLREHEDEGDVPSFGHKLLSAVFNADGTKIITVSRDDHVRVWNADGSGEPLVLWDYSSSGVVRAAFNADRTKVVTVEDIGFALVWNLDGPEGGTPAEPVTLREMPRRDFSHLMGCAAVSPDGTKVVTGHSGARVWNADGSGVPLRLEGHAGGVRSVAFNHDGTQVVTASADGTARVWTVAGASLQAAIRAATSTCLDFRLRMRFLEETPVLAWKRFAECEISHDRSPRRYSPPTRRRGRPHRGTRALTRPTSMAAVRFCRRCRFPRRRHGATLGLSGFVNSDYQESAVRRGSPATPTPRATAARGRRHLGQRQVDRGPGQTPAAPEAAPEPRETDGAIPGSV